MAENHHKPEAEASDDANAPQLASEMSQALRELDKGERTATVLERRLSDIEARIEQLLATVEQNGSRRQDVESKSAASGKSN